MRSGWPRLEPMHSVHLINSLILTRTRIRKRPSVYRTITKSYWRFTIYRWCISTACAPQLAQVVWIQATRESDRRSKFQRLD